MPEESNGQALADWVSIHVVAKKLNISIRALRRWVYVGMLVPRSQIVPLRKEGWTVTQGRLRLWSRRFGNDVRTTYEKLDRYLKLTEGR